jgi:hypothetical protein
MGVLLVMAGIIWGIIAFNMDTTVTTQPETYGSGDFAIRVPSQTVHNIGLLEQRRNHLLLAGLSTLAGVLLIGFGSVARKRDDSTDDLRPCPICAELIQPRALKCRYCGSDVSESFREPPIPEVGSVVIDDRIKSHLALIEEGRAIYENYAEVIKPLGGKITLRGFHYIIHYDGTETRIDRFEELRPWFVENVIPRWRAGA